MARFFGLPESFPSTDQALGQKNRWKRAERDFGAEAD
jgi:hypothetical protein